MDVFFGLAAQEVRDLRRRLGFQKTGWARAAAIHLVVLALFGVALPFLKGMAFLDAVIVGAYACLGVVFASPAAAAPLEFPGPPEATGPEATGRPGLGRAAARIAVCAAYGTAMAWSMLLAALATVYFSAPFFIGLDLESLVECVLFGLALATAAATVAVWVTVRFSASAAKGAMRAVFLSLLAAFFWYSRWLPDVALRGAAVAGTVAAGFFILLRLTLQQRKTVA